MTNIRRKSCRAIILTPHQEILLIKIKNPEGSWEGWITPGGGVGEGESDVSALMRELHEELGMVDINVCQPVWIRTHVFPWKGEIIEQTETFYLVYAECFQPKPLEGIPDLLDLKAFRWWTLQELKNTTERFAPSRLYFHLRDLIEHGVPSSPITVGE